MSLKILKSENPLQSKIKLSLYEEIDDPITGKL